MEPLAGITVIECGVAVAGPLAARYLAHLGADVIKVDSRGNSGFSAPPRWAPPNAGLAALDLVPGSTLNAQKMSVGLDLKSPDGRDAFGRLVARADVFITNLSAPAIESLHITHDDLQAWNPRIISIAMTGFGCGPGPYHQYRSWGPNLSALSGLDYLTGDPDRPPVMHPSPYPDHVSAYHAVVAVLRALIERDRDGRGQGMEMAQLEAVVNVLGPSVLEAQLTGATPMRSGNRHTSAVPRCLLPCRGNDNWLSLEIASDAEWQALCAVEGLPPALRDGRFATKAGRAAHEDELERLLAGWTARHTNRELALRLQSAGVAGNPVQRAWDHVTDPQLEARGFWQLVGHDRLGSDLSSRLPMRFSVTPPRYTMSSPSFGHHTADLLEQAGFLPDQVTKLVEAGVAEVEAQFPPEVDTAVLERPSRRWAWPLLRVFDHVDDDWDGRDAGEASAEAAPLDFARCRVLDLSSPLTAYGTRLLALLGAGVTRVVPPGGSPLAAFPPLHEEGSLFERYMDDGKRQVELDLASPEGRTAFEALAAGADVVYESFAPGELERMGLGWDRLRALNPRLVLVSVTPFGQSGPYRDWKTGELGLWALSGSLTLTGYPDRRPVAPGGGLGIGFVGTTGAIAALAALRARNRVGVGQWVDVSAHEALVFTASGMLSQIDDMADRTRSGVRALGTGPYGYYVCKDRLICLLALMPPHWQSLSAWIHERTGDEAALDPKYRGSGASRYQYIDEVDALVNALAGLYGADEFCQEAQRRGVPAMPVNAVPDLLADPHLEMVGFWRTPEADQPVRWPGPPVRMPGILSQA